MTLSAQDRARRIKIILFDVDGVLTDGSIWLFPGAADSSSSVQGHLAEKDGQRIRLSIREHGRGKGYNAHDGRPFHWRGWRNEVRHITKRISETVALRRAT